MQAVHGERASTSSSAPVTIASGIDAATATVAASPRTIWSASKFTAKVKTANAANSCDLGVARRMSLFDFGIHASEFGQSCWIPTC
jgi:hypothetical protein